MQSRIFLAALFSTIVVLGADEPITTTSESVGTPWSIKATDHFLFSNAPENAADKTLPSTKLFMNEATIRAEYGAFNGKIQFSNRYTPDGNPGKNAAFRLEKKQLVLENDRFDIKLGDSYQEMGRGIALSLYHDPVFGIDHTLEGASLKFRGENAELLTFGGRVNTLRLPVAINPIQDPLLDKDVWMAGMEAKYKYAQDGKVGLHTLLTMNQNFENQKIDKRYATVGMSISQENLVDGVDLYLEGNFLNTEQLTPSRKTQPNGYGSYGSVTWSALPWKAKIEGKDFRQFSYEWQRPPTLEEDVIRQNNFKDVSAVRVGVERRLFETGTANVALSYLAGMDREQGAFINHPVVSTKLPLPLKSELELKGGYRWMPDRQNLIHYGAKAKMKTYKSQAVEAEFRKQFWSLNLNSNVPSSEERNVFGLGYAFTESISVLGGYEYIPTNDPEIGKNFYNVGGAYRTGNLSARAFVGQTSGGTQCNGGVCRQVPPYTGAYLEGSVSF